MDVPLRRQVELKELISDGLTQLLNHHFRRKLITYEEWGKLTDDYKDVFELPSWMTTELELEDMTKGVIVQRASEKAFDEKYLDIAMAERDEYMGFAFTEGGDITFGEMELSNKNEVKEQIATTENHPLILTFQNNVETEESKQPFITLSKEDGKPLCMCFIDGDLQGSPESSHSAAWAQHQRYIAPKVMMLFNLLGHDLDKVYETLDSAVSRSEIVNNCFVGALANGEVLLLFANGKVLNFVKGDKHKKYEWGETSLAFGYEAKAINEEKTTAVKKGLGGKASVPAVKPEEKKPDTAIAAALVKAEDNKTNLGIMIVPPDFRMKSHQSIESWYRANTDAQHMPSAEELHAMLNKPHLAIAVPCKSTWTNAGLNKLLGAQTPQVLLAPPKDQKPASNAKPAIQMVIIPTEQRAKLEKDFWQKVDAKDPKLVANPEDLFKFLEGKPVGSQQMGRQMGAREYEPLTEEAFGVMMKLAPDAAKAAFVELQHEYYKSNLALKQAVQLKKAM